MSFKVFPLDSADATHVTPRNSVKTDEIEQSIINLKNRLEYVIDADAVDEIELEIQACETYIANKANTSKKDPMKSSWSCLCGCTED